MSNQNGNSQQLENLPRHVAIIMDGNGRWAKRRLLPRVEGHRAGAKTVRTVVEESRRLGIRYLTLFAFSTENWSRPTEEVGALMRLLNQYLDSELELLLKNGIRLRAIGDLSRLNPQIRETVLEKIDRTKDLDGMELILALSYGGRDEIVNAARLMAMAVKNGELEISQFNEQLFSRYLYAPDIPDPDLLIRTSDENRISNFLLWELAYTEIVVSKELWPDFNKQEYQRCLAEYGKRERRYGLTKEQMEERRAVVGEQ